MKLKERSKLICYTDGACNKQGKGGAATILSKHNDLVGVSKIVNDNTTNNKMELSAAIAGLILFKEYCEENVRLKYSLELFTDSQYVQKGITEWIHSWKKNNWYNTSGPVKNREYWEAMDKLVRELEADGQHVTFTWVRGHNGNAGNELADRIATSQLECSIGNISPMITTLYPDFFTNLDDEDIYVHSEWCILDYI